MNNRNEMLRNRDDVAEYMKKICKNAEKHNLYITIEIEVNDQRRLL